MRHPSLLGPATAGFSSILSVWTLLLTAFQAPAVNALSFTAVSQPELDLASLGRVALTGDFDATSIYSYNGQSETTVNNNGSESILTSLPNGALTTLSTADANILAMCPFTNKDGSFSGIVVGGNFTSLGNVEAQGVAMFNANTSKVTAMPGLSGSVSALLCDQETNSVYVGGDFKHGNTSNAAVWVDGKGWSTLSFEGFNGPVASILKNDDGHIVFGGSFDGIGNSTSKKNGQIINLQNARITSDATSSRNGFSSPRNIICQTSRQDAEGKTWLLDDNSPGFWRADMDFEYKPTKLRLYNTHFEGRGTKSFLFRRLPDNGIMNFTYADDSGKTVNCDASCPLPDGGAKQYRDFEFVNSVGMNGFMLEIQEWYGAGAGLDGIELFQNDIFAYAINDFNEPACANLDYPSRATQTGAWTVTPSGQSQSNYVTAHVADSDATRTSIVFQPDVQRSGDYSVLLYTPGCVQDGTCGNRGMVNITATVSTGGDPIQKNLYQTNLYDKYDTIYTGHVDSASSSFRPSVTLTPLAGQGGHIAAVASRVQFVMKHATEGGPSGGGESGDLNGLFDFDPSAKEPNTNLTQSVINEAGLQLGHDASIMTLAQHDRVTFVGGNFSDSRVKNIMFVEDGNATALSGGGLNSQVTSAASLDNYLYIGGNFTNTANGGSDDLKYVAAYSVGSNAWSALGGGVNGPVNSVLALPLNVSTAVNETIIAVSGDFNQLLAFDGNPSVSVTGFAVWVPSHKNWLQNINVTRSEFAGKLSTFTTVGNTTILAGSLVSNGMAAGGAVSLHDEEDLSLTPLMTNVKTSSSGGSSGGVYTGIFDTSSDRNLTILGGRFSVADSNGSPVENLAILDGKNNAITGLGNGIDSNSTFVAVEVSNSTLWAGGNVTGHVGDSTVQGFVTYDLEKGKISQDQPGALTGTEVSVNSIAARPDSSEIYLGGSFDGAGGLPCPSVCFYDQSTGQWNRPGAGIYGTVLSLKWTSSRTLMAVGNLTVENNITTVATYDTKEQLWSSFKGASSAEIAGTVTAFTPASTDVSTFWLAGDSADGSTFVTNYDGSAFKPAGNIFDKGTIVRGMEVLPLSADHGSDAYLNRDLILLVTGHLVIPDFGNASAAFFNGTTLTPFLLSSKSNGQPGSMARLFTEKQNPYHRGAKHHSNGIVVLISFCLALACVFLIVIAGVILNKIQRRRQGYLPTPQGAGTDRQPNMQRLPPEYLFHTLKQPNPAAPSI